MKKTLTIVILLVLLFWLPMICAAQQGISEESLQASSQDASQNSSQESTGASSETSSQESTGASSENSSQYSFENSSQWSTDTTSNSPQASTDATTEQSTANSDSSSVSLVVAGAAVSIALTVGGIILTVHVSEAKEEEVIGLQDQIYLADGKDYQDILSFFKLDDRDLIKVNDELVAAGCQIASDQDAADYLAALILKLAERSEKVQCQLRVL